MIGQGDITRSRFLSSTGSPGSYEAADIDPVTGEAQGRGLGFVPDADCTAAGGVITDPADTGAGSDRCRYHFVDQVSVISAEKRAPFLNSGMPRRSAASVLGPGNESLMMQVLASLLASS